MGIFTKRKNTEPISLKAWVCSALLHLLLIGLAINLSFKKMGEPGTDEGSGFEISQIEDTLSMSNSNLEVDSQFDSLIPQNDFQQEIFEKDIEISSEIMPEAQMAVEEKIFEIDSGISSSASIDTDSSWNELQQASQGGREGGNGVSFFGITASGKSFVYIVDHSGSMKGEPLQAALRELVRSLKSLRANMKFNVIFYNSSATSFSNGLNAANPKNKKKVHNWCLDISASGGTNPSNAIQKAFALEPDCIWILSDGAFDDSTRELITKLNSDRQTRVHTLAFMNEDGGKLLQQIAKENGGKYRFVRQPKSFHKNKTSRRIKR